MHTAAIVLALCLAGAPPAKEKPVTEKKEAPRCLAELDVDRGLSPWQGYTGSAEEEAAGKKVSAVADLSKLERVPHLAAHDVGGKPLLAIDRERRRVVVSSEHFSDLERPDVTRSGKTDAGVVKSAALRAEPRRLALFLVASQLVQTLAHVESRVCLATERNGADEYRAHFTGSHVYFTNKRHEAPLEFELVLDKRSGALRGEAR